MSFSQKELLRYSRHFVLDEIGLKGQEKLKFAKVLCVGAGGLGSPLLMYLAAAGVGTLGIVDDDKIDFSNLQRQLLYGTHEVGQKKLKIAKEKLHNLNPNVNVALHPARLMDNNALEIISQYDIVADCTDNFPTRYLVNDACFHLQKPNVYASISQFDGQCSVFCAKNGPCYRCLYDAPPPAGLIPNCAEGGVLGVLPGLLGVMQANETIKLILGIGSPLIGRLLTVDTLSMVFDELEIKQNPDCRLCKHHQPFETLPRITSSCAAEAGLTVKQISAKALHQLKSKNNVFLVDVREPYEYEICNIDGYLIPLREF